MKLSETDIEIIERDNHIPPEKSILTKEERRINMTDEQRKKLFAEILQKELNKVFEKHIEDLKNAYISQDSPYTLYCTKGVEDVRKDTSR